MKGCLKERGVKKLRKKMEARRKEENVKTSKKERGRTRRTINIRKRGMMRTRMIEKEVFVEMKVI
jgi:hypothetical protein